MKAFTSEEGTSGLKAVHQFGRKLSKATIYQDKDFLRKSNTVDTKQDVSNPKKEC